MAEAIKKYRISRFPDGELILTTIEDDNSRAGSYIRRAMRKEEIKELIQYLCKCLGKNVTGAKDKR